MGRLAVIVEASSAGTGRHVTDLSRCLLMRGHSIHLLYGTARVDRMFEKSVEQLGVFRSFEAHGLDLAHDISWSDLSALQNIVRYLRSAGPFDVLHAHSTKAGFLARLAGLVAGTPVVYTPHAILTMNPSIGQARKLVAGALERVLAGVTTRIIAVSEQEQEHIVGMGVPTEKVEFIPNGVDVNVYAHFSRMREKIRTELGLTKENLCIGFVGRLAPQKDPALLLTAFGCVLRKQPNTKLIVVGEGPLRAAAGQLASDLGVHDSVVWCGACDATELYAAFDVLAVSSAYESWPYVVMEGMASGLPIVSTGAGGIRSLVRNGVNGYLVSIGDAEGFADAVCRVLGNENLRQSMGAASLALIEQFSLEAMAECVERVYFRDTAGRMSPASGPLFRSGVPGLTRAGISNDFRYDEG